MNAPKFVTNNGDLLNNKTPVGRGPAGDESLAIWGPEVPAMFSQ